MVEVMVTARDAKGNALAFTMGFGRNVAAAKHAACAGMSARIRATFGLAGRIRTFDTEVL